MSLQCLATTRKVAFSLHPCRILGWSRSRKWVEIAMRALETSLSRPHQNRILVCSRVWKWFRSDRRPLEKSPFHLTEVAFLAGQEEENDFEVPWDLLNHRFIYVIQVEFWACQEAEYNFNAIRPLESSLYRLKTFAFSAGQDAENDF